MTTPSGEAELGRYTWEEHLRKKLVAWKSLPTSTVLQIVLLAGIFLLNFFMQTDPDFWWHLATGRLIVETGSIPQVDPFSYTAAGEPWVAHEWLGEVVIYLSYRSGGYVATVIAFASVITLTFWLGLRTLKLMGLNAAWASALTLWAAAMSMPGWRVRPQAFSYLFFSLYLYLLIRSRKRPDGWLWLLPPAMAVWVNLHAGYVMGLELLGLFLLGEAINRARGLTAGHNSPSLKAHIGAFLRQYLPVSLATIAATAVNPQGIALILYPLSYTSSRSSNLKYVSEWQSPNFHDYYLFIFGASLLLLIVLSSRRSLDWALGIPILALTVMSLEWIRTIPFYALTFAPYLCSRLLSRQTAAVDAGKVEIYEGTPVTVPHRGRATPLNWLVLAVCLGIMTSTLFLSDQAQLGRQPLTSDYPVAGIRYIQQAHLTGNLFNAYQWGGFVIWSFYPERRVFVDGRIDMYGDRFIEAYREVYNLRPNWKNVLSEYDIRVILIEKNSALASLLTASGEWREVFRGPVESVFVKSEQGNGN